jgi:hypothetical protein
MNRYVRNKKSNNKGLSCVNEKMYSLHSAQFLVISIEISTLAFEIMVQSSALVMDTWIAQQFLDEPLKRSFFFQQALQL